MKKKIMGIFVCTLLIATVFPAMGVNSTETELTNYKNFLGNDVIIPPDIENMGSNPGPDPGYYDLSEYMVGTVAIGIIFLESDGNIDPSTEDWTQQEKNAVLGALGLVGGYLQWNSWFSSEGYIFHNLMHYGEIHTINISYEPIIHPSAITDDTWEKLYVAEAMGKLGYTTGDWMQRVRDYSNYLRDNIQTLPGYYGTDWALTVFLVDNSADADGLFSDGYHAYAYLGGPFTVCPHLRPGGPPGPVLREVFAHEMGHIFYATDEYNGQTEYSGYLNASDVEGSSCIMDNLALCVSSGTKLQVGWKDTDSDGRVDILDTFPETTLNPYTPDPTTNPILTYTGSATVVPSTNQNPNGPQNDVTTNKIGGVEYRVDGGSWQYASPVDGNYDDPVEQYTFTTFALSVGTHTIEARATNSLGNIDQTPASDTVTVILNNPPNKPSKPSGTINGKINVQYTYTSSATDPETDQVYYWFDWGDGNNSGWVGPYNSGQTGSAKHAWTVKGTYQIKVKSKDTNDAESPWSDPLSVTMPRNRLLINTLFMIFLEKFPNAFPLLRFLLGL